MVQDIQISSTSRQLEPVDKTIIWLPFFSTSANVHFGAWNICPKSISPNEVFKILIY